MYVCVRACVYICIDLSIHLSLYCHILTGGQLGARRGFLQRPRAPLPLSALVDPRRLERPKPRADGDTGVHAREHDRRASSGAVLARVSAGYLGLGGCVLPCFSCYAELVCCVLLWCVVNSERDVCIMRVLVTWDMRLNLNYTLYAAPVCLRLAEHRAGA